MTSAAACSKTKLSNVILCTRDACRELNICPKAKHCDLQEVSVNERIVDFVSPYATPQFGVFEGIIASSWTTHVAVLSLKR